MSAREWFEHGLAVMREHQATWPGPRNPLQVEYEAAIVTAARELKPKARKLDFSRACDLLPKERVTEIRAPFQAQADAETERYEARRVEISQRLDAVAPFAEVRPGEPRQFAWIYGNAYSSQGFGAMRYAKNAAEHQADHARTNGVEVEVRAVGERPKGLQYPGCWSPDFEVWVHVESDVDVEILKRRPGPDMREWIRLCWKRGVNPRVYNPFLPHGIEERLGLDFFGGECAS